MLPVAKIGSDTCGQVSKELPFSQDLACVFACWFGANLFFGFDVLGVCRDPFFDVCCGCVFCDKFDPHLRG